MKVVVAAAVFAFLPIAATAQIQPSAGRIATYQAARLDAMGNLVITRAEGRNIVVRKGARQASFSDPIVSPDARAVGAQANFPNCCTSYDIPLQLVVYRDGKTHRFTGSGLPIFRWRFVDGGARVAYGQETVHSSCFTHYELRDVDTERLIDAVDVPQPCGQIPDPQPVKVPDWVAAVVDSQLPSSNSPPPGTANSQK